MHYGNVFSGRDTAPMKALYALWLWKKYYHVDGFHLVGDGVPKELIERDPFLYGDQKNVF